MAHVFISYAHDDVDFVALLKSELEKAGYSTWIDNERLRAGEDWRLGIDDAIKSSIALIAVMSKEAYQSQYVTYEWAFALGLGITVIPLMLRKTSLHPRLEVLQYLSFDGRTNRPWNKLFEQLNEVMTNFAPSRIQVAQNAPFAIKQAVSALDSHSFEDRKSALNSLAQMSHPAALEALAQAIEHPTRDVRIFAVLHLARQGRIELSAVSALCDALSENDWQTRETAIEALGKLKDDSIIPCILGVLHDASNNVRMASIIALSNLSTPKSISVIIEFLADANSKIREIAYNILKNMGANSTEDLLNALYHEKGSIRDFAIRILKEIGSPSIPGLLEALKENSSWIRWASAEALGEIGDKLATTGLIEALNDAEWPVRQSAANALEKIATPEAIRAVEKWKKGQKGKK